MNFVDEARLRVVAGDGGDGCAAFLREAYRPKGGPSGGDGGDGGSVYAIADEGENTLLDLRSKRAIKAERGEDGRGKHQHGKKGSDVFLRVPVGTVFVDDETGQIVADMTEHAQVALLARGGVGGRGNARFATATHQAPRRADPGTPGVQREVRLELRLLADAGLVGLPNAGKSSLLARVSAARPKIADYPFTTLAPVLGVVRWADDKTFVLADIPGLIEGAHEGLGLGDRFLRHIQRTAVLVHLIDASGCSAERAVADFDTVQHELHAYGEDLGARPLLLVATKMDLPGAVEQLPELRRLLGARGHQVYAISAATGQGCRELLRAIGGAVDQRRIAAAALGQSERDQSSHA
ncbi:MAG: GTPase ObgE [Deltaproteobacteria bacterium]|nr:GTPase ObgE [Deltaproteobacteria bacterium]